MGGHSRSLKKPIIAWKNSWHYNIVGGRCTGPTDAYIDGTISNSEDTKKIDIGEYSEGYLELVFGKERFVVKRKTLVTKTKLGSNKIPPSHLRKYASKPPGSGFFPIDYYRAFRVAHTLMLKNTK